MKANGCTTDYHNGLARDRTMWRFKTDLVGYEIAENRTLEMARCRHCLRTISRQVWGRD